MSVMRLRLPLLRRMTTEGRLSDASDHTMRLLYRYRIIVEDGCEVDFEDVDPELSDAAIRFRVSNIEHCREIGKD